MAVAETWTPPLRSRFWPFARVLSGSTKPRSFWAQKSTPESHAVCPADLAQPGLQFVLGHKGAPQGAIPDATCPLSWVLGTGSGRLGGL